MEFVLLAAEDLDDVHELLEREDALVVGCARSGRRSLLQAGDVQ